LKNMAKLQADGGHDDLLEKATVQLYEGALLIDGTLSQTAEFVERMTGLMVKATTSTKKTRKKKKTTPPPSDPAPSAEEKN